MKVLEADHRVVAENRWSENKNLIKSNLARETDCQYLKNVHELCALMTEQPEINDVWRLSRVLANNDKAGINAMYAHREWLLGNTGFATRFIGLHESLKKRGVRPDKNGEIPNIEVHALAKLHYDRHRNANTAYELVPKYESNVPYMLMVEKYARHIEALLTYREERGLDAVPGGPVLIDEQDFEQYLQHQNLKDGWL